MVRLCGAAVFFLLLAGGCGPGMVPCWVTLRQVHYPGDTYKAINDTKRVAKVAAWLKNAEINLGDVVLHDGTTLPRTIEPLVLKKQVTAYNPRRACSPALQPWHAPDMHGVQDVQGLHSVSCAQHSREAPCMERRTDKMGKKAVVFANGDVLLFKAVMDNKLAWLIEKHSVAVSKKVRGSFQPHSSAAHISCTVHAAHSALCVVCPEGHPLGVPQIDDRMELIAGSRPKSEKARAVKVTNVVRWSAAQTVHLRKEASRPV